MALLELLDKLVEEILIVVLVCLVWRVANDVRIVAEVCGLALAQLGSRWVISVRAKILCWSFP